MGTKGFDAKAKPKAKDGPNGIMACDSRTQAWAHVYIHGIEGLYLDLQSSFLEVAAMFSFFTGCPWEIMLFKGCLRK